jgi:hypothetical protein
MSTFPRAADLFSPADAFSLVLFRVELAYLYLTEKALGDFAVRPKAKGFA